MTGKPIKEITYAPDGVDEKSKAIAIESVKNALANPFEITQSIFK